MGYLEETREGIIRRLKETPLFRTHDPKVRAGMLSSMGLEYLVPINRVGGTDDYFYRLIPKLFEPVEVLGQPGIVKLLEFYCSREFDDWPEQETDKIHFQEVLQNYRNSLSGPLEPLTDNCSNGSMSEDHLWYWQEAPRVAELTGRSGELRKLKKWASDQKCRVIILYGIGGIGKTALCDTFARELHEESNFEIGFQICLKNPLKFSNFFSQCLQHLSSEKVSDINLNTSDRLLHLLVPLLRKRKCLLILDNFDSILSKDTNDYDLRYQEYGNFIRYIATQNHSSLLLITSRWMPASLTVELDRKSKSIRSLKVVPIGLVLSKKLCKRKANLFGKPIIWNSLLKQLNGNPQLICLVARHIQDVYGGSIKEYLNGGTLPDSVNDFLAKHFEDLPWKDQLVMFCLAIERKAVSPKQMRENLLGAPVDSSMHRLLWRQLLEPFKGQNTVDRFGLQPVIMEFVTLRLINQIVEELQDSAIKLLNDVPLIKVDSDFYLQEAQVSQILDPILQCLDSRMGQRKSDHVVKLISILRSGSSKLFGYAAGNLLNILARAERNQLSGLDLSGLTIRQTDFTNTMLHDTNLSNTKIVHCRFASKFGNVYSLSISPNDKKLAVAGGAGSIRIWEIGSGRLLTTCDGHPSWVFSIDFSPDELLIASAGADKTVRIWDVKTGYPKTVIQNHSNRVRCVRFSPSEDTIASVGEDASVFISRYETSGWKTKKLFQGRNKLYAVTFRPDGKWLATGGALGDLRLYELRTGEMFNIPYNPQNEIRAISFSPSGKRMAVGGLDGRVYLFNWESWSFETHFIAHSNIVRCLDFSQDETILASCGDDGNVHLWELKASGDTALLKAFQRHRGSVRSVKLSKTPGDQWCVSGGEDQTIYRWNTKSLNELESFRSYNSQVLCVAFCKSREILASGHDDSVVRLWDLQNKRLLEQRFLSKGRIWSISFSPIDGGVLACGCGDGNILLLKPGKTLQVIRELSGHKGRVWSVTFDGTGNLLASGSDDNQVILWDIRTGEKTFLAGHQDRVLSVAFHPSEDLLASGSEDKTIRIWRLADHSFGNMLLNHSGPVTSIAFSPDGQSLASCSEDKKVYLWDANRGTLLYSRQEHKDHVRCIAFSHCGEYVASGDWDGTVILWNAANMKIRHHEKAHSSWVESLAFHPRINLLASGSDDETICLWDLNTYSIPSRLRAKLPYERMKITGIQGLNEHDRRMLHTLGALEEKEGY